MLHKILILNHNSNYIELYKTSNLNDINKTQLMIIYNILVKNSYDIPLFPT